MKKPPKVLYTYFLVIVGDDTKLSPQYTYDGVSRLVIVIDETGNKVVGYAYDTDGNLFQRTVAGNSMTTTYTYDYQKHLTRLTQEQFPFISPNI